MHARFRDAGDRLEEAFMSVALAAMTLLTFVQVVLRYLFGTGFVWSLEVTTYLFAWLVLIGMSYGVRTRAHIAVDLLTSRLPPRAARGVAWVALGCALAYCALMIYGSTVFVGRLMTLGNDARNIPLPRWLLTALMPLGFGLLAVRLLGSLSDGVAVTFAFLVIALLSALIVGVPIAIALGLASIVTLMLFADQSLAVLAQRFFSAAQTPALLAIPFFILAGTFMTTGGVAKRMIAFANALVGHFRGGLAMAALLACALFAAVSGSSPATVVAVGSIMIGGMARSGYTKEFAAGLICNAGTLGILIPPSIVMVVYGAVTETSVGTLFIAGVLPGLVLTAALLVAVAVVAQRMNLPRQPRAGWRTVLRTGREAVWGLLLVAIVLGGIYLGVFTPTEAAAVSAVYAFVIAVFVYRDLKLRDVPNVLAESAKVTAMLMFIIVNAMLFAFVLTTEQIPQAASAWIADLGLPAWGFLLVLNVLLLVAGCLMEATSVVLIFAPIVFPIAMQLGIHPVHLGIIMTVNMEIGMVTPPVGLNLFVTSGVAQLPVTRVVRAAVPWLLVLLAVLLLVTYVPWVSLAVPGWLGL